MDVLLDDRMHDTGSHMQAGGLAGSEWGTEVRVEERARARAAHTESASATDQLLARV